MKKAAFLFFHLEVRNAAYADRYIIFKSKLICYLGAIRRNFSALAISKIMRWTLIVNHQSTPISTPKLHESIWFYVLLYKVAFSRNAVTMRVCGLIWRSMKL